MFETAAFSERGPRRENEDAYVCEAADEYAIFAIADGLGGHGGGARAAKIAVDVVRRWPQNLALKSLPHTAHEEIVACQRETEHSEMATTLTVVRINGSKLEGIHVGDTRCVIQRGHGIKKLTTAQTEAQRLFDAGKLTKNEFLNYPRRNILDSALGSKEKMVFEEFSFDVDINDKIILTSDGVHEKIFLKPMLELMDGSAKEIAERIKGKILSLGADDNFTCIVAVKQ